MEVTINYNGQAVTVEVTLEVYEFLDRADHKTENLFHEQRRHWDGREFDEYIITTEQQNILYYARMALCRPGAFLSLWSRNIGSAWPELYPRCRSPPPHSDFPEKI